MYRSYQDKYAHALALVLECDNFSSFTYTSDVSILCISLKNSFLETKIAKI